MRDRWIGGRPDASRSRADVTERCGRPVEIDRGRRSRCVERVVRTIFAQPDHPSAMAQLRRVADGLRPRFAAAAELLEEAAEDVLAH